MFLKLDGTLLVQVFNFAIFFALLTTVFLRPVGAAIRKRREFIDGLSHDYDRCQAEATSLRTRAQSIRVAARREGEIMLSQERAAISNETAEIAENYAHQVARTVEIAHATVASEVKDAHHGEERLVQELAGMIVERTFTGAAA